jgi:hypothetical protein
MEKTSSGMVKSLPAGMISDLGSMVRFLGGLDVSKFGRMALPMGTPARWMDRVY